MFPHDIMSTIGAIMNLIETLVNSKWPAEAIVHADAKAGCPKIRSVSRFLVDNCHNSMLAALTNNIYGEVRINLILNLLILVGASESEELAGF